MFAITELQGMIYHLNSSIGDLERKKKKLEKKQQKGLLEYQADETLKKDLDSVNERIFTVSCKIMAIEARREGKEVLAGFYFFFFLMI
jgi:predicted  nucleic acid-binding Zn-ribbon protein